MGRSRCKDNTGKRSQEGEDVEIIEPTAPAAGASTSTGAQPSDPRLQQLVMLGQLWADNVKEEQAMAYRDLLEQLLAVSHEIYPLLTQADGRAVIESVQDTTGKYLEREHGFSLQVTKEDSIIRRKRWTRVQRTKEVREALDNYYHQATALVEAQSKTMDAIERLGEVINDHDTLVNILNHIQNPCMQVTVRVDALEAR